ncbi:MAG: hypothetical protein ACLTDF_03590 [Coprococcus sp.]
MFSEITEKNSSATRGDMASADYTFNAKTNTWESVQKAPNSDLTRTYMYTNGTSSSGTGLSNMCQVVLMFTLLTIEPIL